MSRNDVASFTVNFTLPPEIIREYFDGVAKVEAAKTEKKTKSTDYSWLMSLLTPILTSYLTKSMCSSDYKCDFTKAASDDKNIKIVHVDMNGKNDKEGTKDGKDVEDSKIMETILPLAKDFISKIMTDVKKDDVKKDDVKKDDDKKDDDKKDDDKKDDDKKDDDKKDDDKKDDDKKDDDKKDDDKKDDDKKDDVKKDEPVFSDCYEELAFLLKNDKRSADLLTKVKKDGNMFKLMQVINGTESSVSKNIEVKVETNIDNEKEVVDEVKLPNQQSQPSQPSPLMGLLSGMLSGQKEGSATIELGTTQVNNEAINNMMKTFGPVMEGFMGKDFTKNLQNMTNANNANTSTTATTTTTVNNSTTAKEKKAKHKTKYQEKPLTEQEILKEMEKDEVD
jgi:hypothetical protein